MNTDATHTLPPFLDPRASRYDMYQHLPYVKNIELCSPDTIRLVSGNVLKYYMIISLPDTVTINTNPIAEFLVEQGKRASLRYHSHIVPKPEDIIDAQEGFQSGISPVEVLHTEEEPDLIDTASSEKEQELTNPFADVSEYDDDFSFLQR
ncbi:MAG: hypothetical protein HFI40_01945 [Lachnospiraceae bacterium]|jgi:hypothetical protein|nr:hypothetical protein [Lachnospiraceae bacterium]MCX4315115.1 hypothetical protein [Lachnospiraceae bacterium]